jgi:arylformamidase
VLDYVLAPEATLTEITNQVTAGLHRLATEAPVLGLDARRMVVAGHSAGAHLAAMAVLAPRPPPVAGLALVSGVFDLAPVAGSYVNEKVRMTAEEAARLSPALRLPPAPLPVLVTVGEDEPLGFHEQSRALAWAWRGHGCADGVMLLPGLNHFSILDALGEPGSALGRAVARML